MMNNFEFNFYVIFKKFLIFRHFEGITTGVGWIIWYLSQRKKRPYSWKIMLFQVLVGISLLLEVNDFPPLLWVLDAHALWHLSTVLPTVLLYRYCMLKRIFFIKCFFLYLLI